VSIDGGRQRMTFTAIAAVAGLVFTILMAVFGAQFVYVVSKTQTEDNQVEVSRRLTEIQARLDEQNRTSADLANRMARIEESNKFIVQSIADLKIAVVPKH
jgi:K+/H+ antiporter YhaU regulatory subunit KhtT